MPFLDLPSFAALGPDPEPRGIREHGAPSPAPRRPRTVLIAGSGPAALEAALALRAAGGPHLRVQLLAPQGTYVHRPVAVVEPFGGGRPRTYDLARLGAHGVRVHRAALVSVDAQRRIARTDTAGDLAYDFLVVATGAQRRGVVPHSVTFGDAAGVEGLHGIVQDLEGGWSRRIAFVAPPGASWTLPIYELALQAAERAAEAGIDAEITLLTHERAPLEVFGAAGAAFATAELERAGVRLITGAGPILPRAGRIVPRLGAEPIEVDRIVALPVVVGHPVPGLPSDGHGFLPVDEHGRVRGVAGVYAAGDGTDFPVKQGGLATQQAEAVAAAIAVDAGLRTSTAPFAPVLRAMLIAGSRAVYLRRHHGAADGEVSERSLWWPPQKVAGQRLAPFLDALDAQDGTESIERGLDRRRARIRRRVAVMGRDNDGGRPAVALEEGR